MLEPNDTMRYIVRTILMKVLFYAGVFLQSSRVLSIQLRQYFIQRRLGYFVSCTWC